MSNLLIKKVSNNDRAFNLNIKKNIVSSMLIKGLSILINFLLVRITYDYINNSKLYGVWLTILSILTWLNFFDIGLGNGLRNKLTESIAKENYEDSVNYISTTYFVMGIIILTLISIFIIFNSYINWNKIFNIDILTNEYLSTVMFVIIVFYLLKLFLSLLNSLFYAIQKSYLPGLLNLLSNLMFLILIIILNAFKIRNFLLLSLVYSISFLLVIIIATIYFYSYREKKFKPNFKNVKLNLINELTSIGFKFLFVQIFTLILFTTDNMIITQVLGPQYVTEYQITQKIFGVFTMLFNIIAAPFWSAYTYHYKKCNYVWIVNTIKKQIRIFFLCIFCVLLMVVFFKPILALWMGSRVDVPNSLVILMAIYSIVFIWYNIFSYVANGIGKLNFQIIIYIVGSLLNIPLSIFMAKNMNLGVEGVILATIICLLLYSIPAPIVIYKTLRKNLIESKQENSIKY